MNYRLLRIEPGDTRAACRVKGVLLQGREFAEECSRLGEQTMAQQGKATPGLWHKKASVPRGSDSSEKPSS